MMTLYQTLTFHPGFQPPKESGQYYCITTRGGLIQTLTYSALHQRFNCYDFEPAPVKKAIKVRWWAPIPHALQRDYKSAGMRALDDIGVQHD